MRLIDVDALIKEHCSGCAEDIQQGCKTDPVCATLMWFEDATTIDAVPVVRCRDCKWWDNDSDLPGCVNEFNGLVCGRADDFCSYGERKDGE